MCEECIDILFNFYQMSYSILHFINPYRAQDTKLQRIHEITCDSIEHAQEHYEGNLEIQVGVVQHVRDQVDVRKKWLKLPDLRRTVLNVGEFETSKPFPLIHDIVKSALAHYADFYIYTNMDIGLQPHFYQFVSDQIDNGVDALIINRRRIEDLFINKSLLEITAEKGKSHPGFDCFVFSREIALKMKLGEICVGIPFIGVAMAHNLFAFARKPVLYDKEFLTFHIGMEIFPPRNQELYWHNRRIFFKVLAPQLWDHFELKKFPYYSKIPFYQLFKWVFNPSLFTLFYLRLLFRINKYRRNKITLFG